MASTAATVILASSGARAQPALSDGDGDSSLSPSETSPPTAASAARSSPAPKNEPWWVKNQAVLGGIFLGSGYIAGSMIFVMPASKDARGEGTLEHADEKRLALVPLAGPLLWWFAARPRIDHAARTEGAWYRTHSCSGSSFNCNSDGIDRFFHYALGLPFAIVTSGTQAAGAILLVRAHVRSDPGSPASRTATSSPTWERKSSNRPSAPSVVVAPYGAGVMVHGTF